MTPFPGLNHLKDCGTHSEKLNLGFLSLNFERMKKEAPTLKGVHMGFSVSLSDREGSEEGKKERTILEPKHGQPFGRYILEEPKGHAEEKKRSQFKNE